MAYNPVASGPGTCLYAPGETVGLKADVQGLKSGTPNYEPYEVVGFDLVGSTITGVSTADWYYEIKSKKNLNPAKNQVVAEADLATWASMIVMSGASCSGWTSTPTVN